MSIISPCSGKVDPDCSKTKPTVRLHPRESILPQEPITHGEEDYFPQKLRVRIKDHKNSPHGKFHRFLFPFSSKFSDLNFASYVLYNLPVLCHVSHTVSLGYLWSN